MFQPITDIVPVDNMNNNGDDDNNYNPNPNENNNNISGGTNFGGEEFNSANTSENQDGGSGSNQDPARPNKKKRYHRHTAQQIQEMEAFFKECPHPDDKQRKELSRQLGLDHLQIKFWFQNKRTQNKNHQERHENAQLRTQNDMLRADNHRYREAIANALCPNCGSQTAIGEMSFEEHHLRLENARLSEEIERLAVMAGKYTEEPIMSTYPMMSPAIPPQTFEAQMGTMGQDQVYGNGGNLSRSITGPADGDKPLIIQLAFEAMEELMRMAQVGEPLWMGGVNGTSLVLNLDEYTRTFQKGLGPRLDGFRTEASRETAVVVMNHINAVEMLMNENQWSMMFSSIISRAITHEVLLTGVAGSFDGAMYLMSAELKVLSPLVSTREIYYVRYCKHQGNGLWAVVDISIDHLIPNLQLKCRRRPSGCLIQEIPNGYAKVTWVEHMEVDDRGGVDHYLYKHLITTGQALGANRWVSSLDRQCERIASIMTISFSSVEPDGLIMVTDQAKRDILILSERMARSFFAGVTATNGHIWQTFTGNSGDGIRVMTSNSINDPGRPPGVVLCAATSFWIPVPPKSLFDFLRDINTRAQWDVLSTGAPTEKLTQIGNGRDNRNCISLLRSKSLSQKNMMIVQECSTEPTASFVIYAPVDATAVEIVLHGGDPDYVALLPSGFAILPDGTAKPGREGGALVTVAFQMLVDTTPSAKLSFSCVATVENLILATMHRIKALFPFQAVA